MKPAFLTDPFVSSRENMNPIEWLHSHVNQGGDDCLIWPWRLCNGYGFATVDRKQRYAHRVMCELVNGPPPTPRHQASHSCGKGHLGCVHPRHLSWKTNGENQRDRAAHGTRNVWTWRGKITQAQADEILELKGKVTQKELAARFGISRSRVSTIHCGKAWITGPRWNKETPHTPLQARIVGVLRDSGRALTVFDVGMAAGIPQDSARQLLPELARRGIIQRVARGQYRAEGSVQ